MLSAVERASARRLGQFLDAHDMDHRDVFQVIGIIIVAAYPDNDPPAKHDDLIGVGNLESAPVSGVDTIRREGPTTREFMEIFLSHPSIIHDRCDDPSFLGGR